MSNKVKKYLQFINEASESNYDDIKQDIKTKIENTIKNSGGEYKSFVDSFIEDSSKVSIEKLINDSDVYEFWRTYENDIDSILNKSEYFEKSPSDMNVTDIYKYVIESTKKAILSFVQSIAYV